MSLPWAGIIVHHSLTADSGTVSWAAIRKYHTDPLGPPNYRMRDIGYHAGVELVGDSYETFFGRPTNWHGAHTVGRNRTHLGFLFVGNFDLAPPPEEMLFVAAERVLIPWMAAFDIGVANVEPHRQYADKTCPGTKFDMTHLRQILLAVQPGDFGWRLPDPMPQGLVT